MHTETIIHIFKIASNIDDGMVAARQERLYQLLLPTKQAFDALGDGRRLRIIQHLHPSILAHFANNGFLVRSAPDDEAAEDTIRWEIGLLLAAKAPLAQMREFVDRRIPWRPSFFNAKEWNWSHKFIAELEIEAGRSDVDSGAKSEWFARVWRGQERLLERTLRGFIMAGFGDPVGMLEWLEKIPAPRGYPEGVGFEQAKAMFTGVSGDPVKSLREQKYESIYKFMKPRLDDWLSAASAGERAVIEMCDRRWGSDEGND